MLFKTNSDRAKENELGYQLLCPRCTQELKEVDTFIKALADSQINMRNGFFECDCGYSVAIREQYPAISMAVDN